MDKIIKEQKTELEKMAEKFSEENGLDIYINEAYIENVGTEYAKAEDVSEAYQGEYETDVDFVQQLVEECGDLPKDLPAYIHIDWEGTARDIMMDYFEVNGYYFRNL